CLGTRGWHLSRLLCGRWLHRHTGLPSVLPSRNRWLSLSRGTLPVQPGTPERDAIMVFVLDTEKRSLSPCHPARARRLLTAGKAAVGRRSPFTTILKRAIPNARPEPLRLKIDPGSKVTGLAVVQDATGQLQWAAELMHRGKQMKERLDQPRACRRGRQTRY